MRDPVAVAARWHEVLLLAASAIWGIAVCLALRGGFHRPAPPGQLPGFQTAQSLDAGGSFQFLLFLVCLPLLSAVVFRWTLQRALLDGSSHRWAIFFAAGSLASALWIAGGQAPPWSVVALPLIGLAAAVMLRRRPLEWCVEDVVLLPVALTVFYALLEMIPEAGVGPLSGLAALITSGLRFVTGSMLREAIFAARSFAPVPLLMVLQSTFVDRRVNASAAVPVLIGAIVLPFLTALVLRRWPSSASPLRTFVIVVLFPLVLLTFPSTRGTGYVERLPRVDFFENGHSLMPASEMAEGELPWRDVVPGHGLIEDGLLDLVAMRVGDDRVGRVLMWRWRFASLNSISLYLLVLAATRSPEAGMLAFMMGSTLFAFGVPFGRSVISLLTLAAAVGAVTRRQPRYMIAAGALLVLTGFHSLDFFVYAAVAVTASIALYGDRWSEKIRALWMFVLGAALVTVPSFGLMSAMGIADDFLRTTFLEILPLGPAYSLGFPGMAPLMPAVWNLPDVLLALLRRDSFPIVAWFVILCVTFVASCLLRRSSEASGLAVIGFWIIAAAISFVERQHVYFVFAMPVFITAMLMLMWKEGNVALRTSAVWIAVLVVALCQPAVQLGSIANVRTIPTGVSSGWSEYGGLRRSRGALLQDQHVQALERLHHTLSATLGEGETFFDFSNTPILYFLLQRPAPIRQYEVPFFEAESLQREVIRELESNARIRVVVLQFPGVPTVIDGVPNDVRAPLVAQYLRENFQVFVDEGGLTLGIRNVAPGDGAGQSE